jgi:predicted transposase/invertase (TIGR01784 family)
MDLFLKNGEVRDDFTAQGLSEAKDKLDKMKMSETEYKAYQRYLRNLHDIASEQHTKMADAQVAIAEAEKKAELRGKMEGELKGKIEIAKKLKQMGLPIADIATATGLSQTEVENLQ